MTDWVGPACDKTHAESPTPTIITIWTMHLHLRRYQLSSLQIPIRSTSLRPMSSKALPDAFVFTLHPDSQTTTSHLPDPVILPSSLWSSARTTNATKPLENRVVYTAQGPLAALVSLGFKADFDKRSNDARRELIRKATGVGVGSVKNIAISAAVETIQVDGGLDAHASGGLSYSSYRLVISPHRLIQLLGQNSPCIPTPLRQRKTLTLGEVCLSLCVLILNIHLHLKGVKLVPTSNTDASAWTCGEIYAEAQILAREVRCFTTAPGHLNPEHIVRSSWRHPRT